MIYFKNPTKAKVSVTSIFAVKLSQYNDFTSARGYLVKEIKMNIQPTTRSQGLSWDLGEKPQPSKYVNSVVCEGARGCQLEPSSLVAERVERSWD